MEIDTFAYDRYIAALFAPQDEALVAAIGEMATNNIPKINVSGTEGKLLHVLALAVGARRILEIGTLGGYSGIHFARALPVDGKLVTLEIDERHAKVARTNFDRAGVGDKVEIRVGPASETVKTLAASDEPPFDLVFIDANKDGYVDYLRLSQPLLRVGGLMLADNTLPDAVFTDEESGTKSYNAAIAQNQGMETIIVPVLRQHGVDGLTISFKRASVAGK